MVTLRGDNSRKITNVVVMVISFVVIAAVVISVVVVADGPEKDDLQSTHNNGTIASLDTVCGYTDYKETCKNTLAPVGRGNQSEVTIYFRASVNATLKEMRRAKGISEAGVKKATSNYMERYTLEDCMQLLDLGIDQLNYVLAMVPTSDLLTTKSDDVRNSLSAVVSYQQTCIEGLVVAKSKSNFDKDLQESIELASNSLAIIYEYSDNDDKKGEAKKTRRLLSIAEEDITDKEEDNGGYPTWISAADRRLLESKDVVIPHAIVAQDGTGQYDTISEALKAYPKNLQGRYIIYVKSGEYRETVTVAKEKTQVFMYGDGPSETVIVARWKNTTVYRSATFSAVGKGFICKHMGFTSAGYRPDKVALRVQSDQSAFFNCSIDGSIGPLFAVAHRQFYGQCNITGNSHIIRGDSTVVIQNSQIIVKKPVLTENAIITAHARSDRHESTGFVLHNCSIMPDEEFKSERLNYSTYLGEPLGTYSRTVVMESMLGDFIHPEGWHKGNGAIGVDTVNFLEYKNSGPGAQTNTRVKWPGYREIKDKDEAMRYSAGRFIQIEKWLTLDVKLPYQAGLYI